MDPASAIAAAIGQISGLASNIIDSGQTGWRAYNARLQQEGAPTKKDWFKGFRTDYTKQLMTVVIALLVVFGLSIVAIAFSKNSSK